MPDNAFGTGVGGPVPTGPIQAVRTPPQPGDDFNSLWEYVKSHGGQLPPGVSPQPGAQAPIDLQSGSPVPMPGTPGGAMYKAQGGSPGVPPAGGTPPPANPGIATAPGTMPPPLFAMPQMYDQANMPANVSMRQLPNGQYVAADQYGNAQHALGLDRLPDFNTYLQQQKRQLGPLYSGVQYAGPSAGPLGGVMGMGGMGAPEAMMGLGGVGAAQNHITQQDILNQYLGLQKAQSQADQDATGRMGTAGQLGVSQQAEGRLQQAQAYAQGPGLADAAKLAAIQGNMSNPNGTPENLQQVLGAIGRTFPAAPGQSAPAAAQAGEAPASQPGGDALGNAYALLGADTAAKLSSNPDLKGGGHARQQLDFIIGQKGPQWVQQNWPALQQYLNRSDPHAIDDLRASAHPSVVENVLKAPSTTLAALLPTNPQQRGNYWSAEGRRKLAEANDTPIDEQFGAFLGMRPTTAQNNSALIRALIPQQ